MIPAIYFKQDAFTSTGAKLMGRNVAGESFLRALFDRCGDGALTVQVDDNRDIDAFRAEAARWGSAVKPEFIASSNLPALRKCGGCFYPGPGLETYAWARAPFGAANWSLSGVNHTTSSERAMQALVETVTAPLESWDAMICTSTAVKANILALVEGQQEYLRARLGAQTFPMPQLPVIPLGVHCDDFVVAEGARGRWRRELGIGDDECVVLFVGRLSFHAKAHPVALYSALERVNRAGNGAKVTLVEYGRFFNQPIEQAFAHAAAALCPSVRRIVLDGRDLQKRDAAWAVADVFCSFADNLQEAFGITPVEAMAAGLPVVVSDWDGYKDTVRHEIDGFRIPTMMPRAGLGTDLALRFQVEIDSFDRYGGYTSALVAVDIDAAADALGRLAASPDLRRSMGESGRRRARDVYDWKRVFPMYEALWAEQAAIRAAASPVPPRIPPRHQDPFHLFASYPTFALDEHSVVALVADNPAAAIEQFTALQKLAAFSFPGPILPNDQEIAAMLTVAGGESHTADELIEQIDPARRPIALRGLAWLLKIGILRRVASG